MSDTKLNPNSMKDVSFEDALKELEEIVTSLERGEVSLDEAIAAFERGTELKSHCQERLEEARMKVERINVPNNSKAPESVSDFDTSDS